MAISKKIFSLIFLIFVTSLFSITPQEVYSNLIKKYSQIKTFKADFSQYNYWAEVEENLLSFGKIYYTNQKLALDYYKPKKQKVIMDTSSVLIWYVADKQALLTKNNGQILKPIDVIKQYWKNSEKEINAKNDTIFVKLKNKEQKINVTLKNYLIIRLEIVESGGNIVDYKFKNIRINKSIDKKIFSMKLPKEVKVFKH